MRTLTPHRQYLTWTSNTVTCAPLREWTDARRGIVSGLLEDGYEVLCVCIDGRVLTTNAGLEPRTPMLEVISRLNAVRDRFLRVTNAVAVHQ